MNRCVSTPARKGPTWSHVPWTAGQGRNEAQQIQNKQVDNSSQPGPKPKTTTRVRVLQPARFGYTGANGNEARQIQNKQVDNSSLDQTKSKTTRLQKRVSCGMVLMASTMLHEKCCNTVLQIGAPTYVGSLSQERLQYSGRPYPACVPEDETAVVAYPATPPRLTSARVASD